MQAYREGRWTQPTVDDPVLFSGMGGTKNVIRPMYEYLPNSSKNTVSGDLGQTTDGVTMSQPNQIYLDDYVRSFGGYKTSSGVSSSIGTSAPSPMHIQSSDAFLLGALTGDWSMAAGSTEAALLGTSIDLSTYGVPSKTRERQRADQVQHPQSVFHVGNRISEPQNSGSTDYKPWNAASNSVVPNPTIHPRYNRDDTHVGPSHGRFFTSSTVPQGGPFSSQSDMWSSSFAPTTHHPSMSLHPASNGPEVGSTGERGHAADEGDAVTFVFPAFDTQTAALWDDFLIGLGVDHTVI